MFDRLRNLVSEDENETGPRYRCVNCGEQYDHPVTPCENCGREILTTVR